MQETSEEKEVSLCETYTWSPTDLNQQPPPPFTKNSFLIYHRALSNLGDRRVSTELCLETSRANRPVETETCCTDYCE